MAIDSLDFSTLFQQRMDALYQSDADGRVVCTNEWESSPSPRFHLLRTAHGVFCRYQASLPNEIVRRLETLSRQEPTERFSEPLPLHREQYLDILAEHAPVQTVWSGPAFMALEETAPSTETIAIDENNAYLLRERMADWFPDVPYRRPFVVVVRDGGAVSLCASVRITNAVHCAGVETHASYRRHGYAADAVASWSSAVRAQGAVPFYSTSWENVASQRIARRLQMTLAGVDFYIR